MCQASQADPEGADKVWHPCRQVLKVAERQADALWVYLLAYALQDLRSAHTRRKRATTWLLLHKLPQMSALKTSGHLAALIAPPSCWRVRARPAFLKKDKN